MIYLFVLVFTQLALTSISVLPEVKEILILGGNGFIGSKTTTNLLKDGHNITLLNRGNVYYGSDTKIQSYILRNIVCDRRKSLKVDCKELSNDPKYYDVVIDFTSYSPEQVQQVVELFSRRVGLYLFISSGAVYEVSSKNHTRPSREEEAIRPVSHQLRRKLQKEESYGDQKLRCEEVLQNQQKEGGVPYVILRLPVVIGPRDTTFRWWIYQLWVLTHAAIHRPIHFPNEVERNRFSMAYVDDVAGVISTIVTMDKTKVKSIQNMPINLAMKEHVTLLKIVEGIAKYYGIDQIQYEKNSTWYAYPIGSKGPLDVSFAHQVLGWDPMPWNEALKYTCGFYHRAMTTIKYVKEKEKVLNIMFESVVPEEYYKDFIMTLREHFGEKVFERIIHNAADTFSGNPGMKTVSDVDSSINGAIDIEKTNDEL